LVYGWRSSWNIASRSLRLRRSARLPRCLLPHPTLLHSRTAPFADARFAGFAYIPHAFCVRFGLDASLRWLWVAVGLTLPRVRRTPNRCLRALRTQTFAPFPVRDTLLLVYLLHLRLSRGLLPHQFAGLLPRARLSFCHLSAAPTRLVCDARCAHSLLPGCASPRLRRLFRDIFPGYITGRRCRTLTYLVLLVCCAQCRAPLPALVCTRATSATARRTRLDGCAGLNSFHRGFRLAFARAHSCALFGLPLPHRTRTRLRRRRFWTSLPQLPFVNVLLPPVASPFRCVHVACLRNGQPRDTALPVVYRTCVAFLYAAAFAALSFTLDAPPPSHLSNALPLLLRYRITARLPLRSAAVPLATRCALPDLCSFERTPPRVSARSQRTVLNACTNRTFAACTRLAITLLRTRFARTFTLRAITFAYLPHVALPCVFTAPLLLAATQAHRFERAPIADAHPDAPHCVYVFARSTGFGSAPRQHRLWFRETPFESCIRFAVSSLPLHARLHGQILRVTRQRFSLDGLYHRAAHCYTHGCRARSALVCVDTGFGRRCDRSRTDTSSSTLRGWRAGAPLIAQPPNIAHFALRGHHPTFFCGHAWTVPRFLTPDMFGLPCAARTAQLYHHIRAFVSRCCFRTRHLIAANATPHCATRHGLWSSPRMTHARLRCHAVFVRFGLLPPSLPFSALRSLHSRFRYASVARLTPDMGFSLLYGATTFFLRVSAFWFAFASRAAYLQLLPLRIPFGVSLCVVRVACRGAASAAAPFTHIAFICHAPVAFYTLHRSTRYRLRCCVCDSSHSTSGLVGCVTRHVFLPNIG